MTRAETVELIRSMRGVHRIAFGKHPRRGRMTKPIPPSAIKAEYLKGIESLVLEPLWSAVQPLLTELTDSRSDTALHNDADAGKIRALVEKISEQYRRAMLSQQDRIEELAARMGDRTSKFQREQLSRQLKQSLGVDPLLHEPRDLAKRVTAFTHENVSLIKTIPSRFFQELEPRVVGGVRAGMRSSELTAIVQERYNISKTNATRIANDQIGKFYGELNQVRQGALGITSYIWHTVHDNRVREEHEDYDGNEYQWSDPPDDGHPGEAVNCRCWAEPVLDDLL
jgi:SPP1 gp7 family putative phage head morphogenesis protein